MGQWHWSGCATRRRAIILTTILAASMVIHRAEAYTQTLTPQGHGLRWMDAGHLNLAGNPINRSGLNADEVWAAVVRGLQRWQSAAGPALGFDYWQGTAPRIYQANSGFNGYSNLYFASHSQEKGGNLSSGVLGITQVWYNAETGRIVEADIILNDRDFLFTTNPKDTSGFGSGGSSFSGGHPKVFIENVITHELGHAFGLSHTQGLQSTMLFMESPEQAHLGCDDQVGIRAIYAGGRTGTRGELTGQVISGGGTPVYGANVLAISRARGTVLAMGLTDAAGRYSISGLEAGTYFLMAEPFIIGAQAMPSFFSSIKPQICEGGKTFSRTFLTDASGNRLLPLEVVSGGSTEVPAIFARCTPEGEAAVSSSNGIAAAHSSLRGEGTSGWGWVDTFSAGGGLSFPLQSVRGRLQVQALSYSLYSPLKVELTLLNSRGEVVPQQVSSSAYAGDSGFNSLDTVLTVEGLPLGDYEVVLQAADVLSATSYPAGPLLLDRNPFVVLTGTSGTTSAIASELSDNARCRSAEQFPAYSSPPGDPPLSNTQEDDKGTGFCGSIVRAGGGAPPPGPGGAAIFGWFLPWLVMAMSARLFARGLRGRPRTANL